MNILKIVIITVLLQFLSSCMYLSSTDSYQQEYIASLKQTKVQVYYPTPPACDYDVIGYVEINGLSYSKTNLFQRLADAAEELGAKAVVVTYLEQLDIKEYVGTGEAIRCKK